MDQKIAEVKIFYEKLSENLEKVIVGKKQVLDYVIIGLLCHGHLLIDDVPGVGKTMLAKSLSKSLGCSFNRIQFTPDMLPSDITGVSIFNQNSREFEFRPGPIVAQIVLADEINRATPKTQSALLEAMEERQITVDGKTFMLPKPFLVLATQNPIEYEGTFPLPEAQLDRFLMKIRMGYPSLSDEIHILDLQQLRHPIETLEEIATVGEILAVQEAIKHVYVSDSVKKYVVELVRATRDHSDVYLGVSPRGSLSLYRVSQARAAAQGRAYVLPDDVKIMAKFVMGHRMVIQPAARLRNLTADQIISEVLNTVSVPGGDFSGR
ncbi:MAG: AAA family ATPase [Chloroflexi bacterium HGW-Chloroflexi-10]|nr:MAG: AAA family ATPase [Chloroflexi bacterium HGW-Chloroflexi-10]